MFYLKISKSPHVGFLCNRVKTTYSKIPSEISTTNASHGEVIANTAGVSSHLVTVRMLSLSDI